MRVFHIIGVVDPGYGGPVEATLSLAKAQSLLGVPVEVVTTDRCYGRRGTMQRPTGYDFPIHMFRTCAPHRYGTSPRLVRYLAQQLKPGDIAHFHNIYEFGTSIGAAIARRRGATVLVEPHGALTKYHHSKKRWKKGPHERLVDFPTLRRAAVVLCSSQTEASQLLDVCPNVSVVVVCPGVDLPVSFPRHSANLGAPPTVLFLSRITEKKHLDVTISALAVLRQSVPNAVLRVVGPGESSDVDRLRRLAVSKGVEAAVHFVGPLFGDQKWAEYFSADLFILLSEDESFGQVAIEALSAGTPVLATHYVASVKDLEGERAVRLVDLDERAAGLAAAEMLHDPDLRNHAQSLADRLREERSWTTAAKGFLHAYEEASAQPHHAPRTASRRADHSPD